jgi:uroporphyrinogen-III synthase
MEIKKILVSQPQPTEKSPYADLATQFNVEVVFRPFIKIEGLTAKEFRQQRLNIADYTGIIFTSKAAADHFFRLAEETRVAIPDTLKYFCTTESIANYLQKYIVYRKRKIFFGLTGRLEDKQLGAAFTKHHKEKFLFPISDVHKDNAAALDSLKIDYTKAIMYRTVSNDFEPGEPFDYDMLVIFTPAGIQSLKKNFPKFDQKKQKVAIACLGPATIKAAEEAGLTVDIKAPAPGTPSMPAAIAAYLKK